MRRSNVIAGLTCIAAASALAAARAQQTDKMRRVGVLIATAETDPETRRRVEGLLQGFREAGWIEGRNIHFEYRFSGPSTDRMRQYASEVVDTVPDAIIVHSNDFLSVLREINRTIPTVFTQVGDPVGSGFIENLARPGGNFTGFTTFESDIGGKWVQTLKEIAPLMTRALILLDARITANLSYLHAAELAASATAIKVTSKAIQDPSEFDRSIAAFEGGPSGGLVALPSPMTAVNRERVIALAAQYRTPSVYPFRFFAISGGLVSYGVDTIDLYRRAAAYVDRIFKGAKPADLPVQQPTKFELVINLRTAKTIGLDVPRTMLARADEVIE